MEKTRYSIMFSSLTGNTRMLADAIREALPEENCDYFGPCKGDGQTSEVLYVGFWTDRGNADKTALELLKSLRNKKIFLFGTAGFGVDEGYFKKILNNISENIDPSNQILGEYMCQGKMSQSVRERYVKMKEQPDHNPNLDMLIANFDHALSHPDEKDLENLRKKVQE